jgi:hypothetical protein
VDSSLGPFISLGPKISLGSTFRLGMFPLGLCALGPFFPWTQKFPWALSLGPSSLGTVSLWLGPVSLGPCLPWAQRMFFNFNSQVPSGNSVTNYGLVLSGPNFLMGIYGTKMTS